MSPFSREEAREIGVRANWICEDCGSDFRDGNLMDASHDDEVHFLQFSNPEAYHNTENGKLRCLPCHLKQHVRMGDWKSVNKIANRIWNHGIVHRVIYEKEPDLLLEHRLRLTNYLTNVGAQGKVHIVDNDS